MWEITLMGNTRDLIHFAVLEDELKAKFENPPLVAISLDDGLVMSIAVLDKKTIRHVKNLILETIIKISKEEYFRENLKILGSDKSLNNFIIMSLTCINLRDEVDFARVRVKFTKHMYIRSLVMFKLNRFYVEWERIIKYFNFYFSGIVKNQVYLEFLKFLASNMSTRNEIIFLEEHSSSMHLLDKNRKIIKKSPKTDEIGLIVNLIVYSPKKLIINCLDTLSASVVSLIKYIFEDKLSVII